MSDKKLSKVKSITGAGTWENANGVDLGNGTKGFFSFEYSMEDGTVLKANHKSDKGFDVGSEVEYVITGSNDYGNRGKVQKPSDNPQGGGGGYKASKGNQNASFALSYSKDLCVGDPQKVVDQVTAIADGLLKWLNAN
jgi:hypothetical protein